MRAFEFTLTEDKKDSDLEKVNKKLSFILDKLEGGAVTDPETIDFIYKILNKPEIQQTIAGALGGVEEKDKDVQRFQKLNNSVLSSVLRKLPIKKEELDNFLTKWNDGEGFVNTGLLKSGNKGSIDGLITDPVARVVFEKLETVRSQYRMPKKGTTGYGEFGLAMLSPNVLMKAPGDIEVEGTPVECKGNSARLYADERTAQGLAEADEPQALDAEADVQKPEEKKEEPKKQSKKRGSEPGLLNNVFTALQEGDEEVAKEAINALVGKGVDQKTAEGIVEKAKVPGADYEDLAIAYWKASFNDYVSKIKMPILLMGNGEFYMSDKPEDFIGWGCTPKMSTPSNWGYMYGRTAGQSRETYSRIYLPSLK